MTSEKSIERSIDTLQRIYAIIAGLAINEALKRTFLNSTGDVEISPERLPEFLAFIATAVPFVHGMNRHLDKTLASAKKPKQRGLFVLLLVDFVVFILETSVLFLLASSVKSQTTFFQLLMMLLALDLVWSIVTYSITKSVIMQWAIVNVSAIVLLAIGIWWIPFPSTIFRLWSLMFVALARTFFDYFFAWNFYFPNTDEN